MHPSAVPLPISIVSRLLFTLSVCTADLISGLDNCQIANVKRDGQSSTLITIQLHEVQSPTLKLHRTVAADRPSDYWRIFKTVVVRTCSTRSGQRRSAQ